MEGVYYCTHFIQRKIKQTVVMIEEYHFLQLNIHCYTAFLYSHIIQMQDKRIIRFQSCVRQGM
jgi:hypothetical protein